MLTSMLKPMPEPTTSSRRMVMNKIQLFVQSCPCLAQVLAVCILIGYFIRPMGLLYCMPLIICALFAKDLKAWVCSESARWNHEGKPKRLRFTLACEVTAYLLLMGVFLYDTTHNVFQWGVFITATFFMVG